MVHERRRRFLYLLGGTTSLAGCSSQGDTEDSDQPAEGQTSTSAETQTQTSTEVETETLTETEPQSPTETGRQTSTETEIRTSTETETDQPTDDAAWPTFQYDARNTGYKADAKGPDDPETKWRVELERNSSSFSDTASPAVVDDAVYAGVRSDQNSRLVAFNRNDGSVTWEYGTEDVIESSPAVSNNTVFVGSNDGRLYAVNEPDGEKRWAFEIPESGVRCSPTVANGTVFFWGRYGRVFALNTDTGDERWEFTTGIEGPGSGGMSPFSAPSVSDGVVTFGGGSDGVVYAVDIDNGETIWEFKAGGFVVSQLVSGGTVYAAAAGGSGSSAGKIFALDHVRGETQWETETNSVVTGSPAVTDEALYFGTRAGVVFSVDKSSGEKRWQFDTGDRLISSPAVNSDTAYVGSSITEDGTYVGGKLYALRVSDGTEHWKTEFDGQVSPPALSDSELYFGTSNGKLHAVQ